MSHNECLAESGFEPGTPARSNHHIILVEYHTLDGIWEVKGKVSNQWAAEHLPRTPICTLLCALRSCWPVGSLVGPVTSSRFQPMGNEGKVPVLTLASEPWPPPHNYSFSGVATGSLHPCTKRHSSSPAALSLSPLHIYFPPLCLCPVRTHSEKSSCHLLQSLAEFLSLSLNGHTFVKVPLLNSSQIIPACWHNLFSARALTDILRKDKLIKSAILWGKEMGKALPPRSQEIF